MLQSHSISNRMNFVDCFPWCHLVYCSYFSVLCISWLVVVSSGGLIEFRFDFFFFLVRIRFVMCISVRNRIISDIVFKSDVCFKSWKWWYSKSIIPSFIGWNISIRENLSTQITLHRTYKINASFPFLKKISF